MRVLATVVLLAALAAAQQQSPYAGEQHRAIKSLSDQELTDLREGNGMGLAKAAELNGYPGPKHVLEMANELGLSAAQKIQIEDEFAQMKAVVRKLGAEVIAAEERLEQVFAQGKASAAEVEQASLEAAELRGKLRAAHLNAHIATAGVLTVEQARRYQHLRGYASGHQPHH